jgi:DNA-binding NtrC family response regulator
VQPQPNHSGDPPSPDPRCTVMVVEDDPSSRNAMMLLLKHFGFHGVAAGSVSGAMSLLDSRPAVMILDLMLPDGNGSEVLEHVRRSNLPIRVAVATGTADWRSMVDEARLRPDAVFVKPLDFNQLVRWIHSACGTAN